MKDFLKQHLKEGKEITFDNERTFTDDFRSMECTFRNETKNAWDNGLKLVSTVLILALKLLILSSKSLSS